MFDLAGRGCDARRRCKSSSLKIGLTALRGSDDTVDPERSLPACEKIDNIDAVHSGAVILPLALARMMPCGIIPSRRRTEPEAHGTGWN